MEKYSFVNICRHYGKKQVLAGATGQFPAGSFVGILGLNGSGKTTLLNILGNLDRRFTGVITLRGKKVAYMRTRMPYPEWWKVSDVLAGAFTISMRKGRNVCCKTRTCAETRGCFR